MTETPAPVSYSDPNGYTICERADGWYILLTATGEELRGPLLSETVAVMAVERYERMTAALGDPRVAEALAATLDPADASAQRIADIVLARLGGMMDTIENLTRAIDLLNKLDDQRQAELVALSNRIESTTRIMLERTASLV